jgi:hypothetical protein
MVGPGGLLVVVLGPEVLPVLPLFILLAAVAVAQAYVMRVLPLGPDQGQTIHSPELRVIPVGGLVVEAL